MRINFFSQEISNIHAAALILGAAGFLSKILGVFRDHLLASHFGAGRTLDIYYAAFQIPDFMSVVFLLGAGSAAILPVFQEYLKNDKTKARILITKLSILFFIVSTALIVFMIFFAPLLMRIVAPGFSGNDFRLLVRLSRIILFSPLLLGLSSIFSSVVQSFNRFFSYALSPILYNIGIIIGIIFCVPFFGILGLGVGVLLGALFHTGVQLLTVRNLGFFPKIRDWQMSNFGWWKDKGILRIVKLSFPRVIALSFSQITMFFMVVFGSMLAEGSIAVFNLAYNLYFVPIGIFGLSYSVTVFPRLSRSYMMQDGALFFEELFLGLRSILFWVLPASALFIVLRAHIVRVAFGAGLFSWQDTRLTVASLAIFAVAMGLSSLNMLLIRGFYAIEKTLVPLVIDVVTLVISLVSAYVVVRIISSGNYAAQLFLAVLRMSDFPHSQVLGLVLGFALGTIVNALLLYYVLLRTSRRVFHYRAVMKYRELRKIVIASCIAGIVTYGARIIFADAIELHGFVSVLLDGILAGGCGMIVYVFSLYFMRSEDLFSIFGSMQKRLLRLGVLPKEWDGEIR